MTSIASHSDQNAQVRLAVIMDPIAEAHPDKDSTLSMLLAAQKRESQIWYSGLNDICRRWFGRHRMTTIAETSLPGRRRTADR